jgi:hypothetical protein
MEARTWARHDGEDFEAKLKSEHAGKIGARRGDCESAGSDAGAVRAEAADRG